ncbi:hypothetical protein HOP50_04g28610 [Chloropicon primus]|nr:hypothetical protein HOP50_04g28610 [Chloropicon primus]
MKDNRRLPWGEPGVLGTFWTAVLLALSLLGVLAAAEVVPPSGVVVRDLYTLDGTSFVVEWIPPRCVDDVYNYCSFTLYVFEVKRLWQIQIVGQNIPGMLDNMDQFAVQIIETHTGEDVLCTRSTDKRKQVRVSHKVTGLEPYTEYLVYVKSKEGTIRSAATPNVTATPSFTPKGSGREQANMAGLDFTHVKFTSCYGADVCDTIENLNGGSLSEFSYARSPQILVFDAEGDGDMDVLFVTQADADWEGGEGQENWFLKNNGTGGFIRPVESEAWPSARSDSRGAVAGDFRGVGSMDVFIVNSNEQNVFMLNQGGDGKSWTNSTAGDATALDRDSRSVVAGDFDGDGDLDLFIVNYRQNNELLWNNGDGTFTAATAAGNDALSHTHNTLGVITADVNGDGHLDLVELGGTDYSANVASEDKYNFLYLNDGSGNFQLSPGGDLTTSNMESTDATTGDFNGDGHIDIVVVNKFQSQVNELLINDGTGSFTRVSGMDASGSASAAKRVTSCDLDGDGDLDVYITGGPDVFLLNDGTGNFTEVSNVFAEQSQSHPPAPACFDATGNGLMDLWIDNNNLNLNKGSFPMVLHTDAGDATAYRDASYDAQVFDADNDGDMDLLLVTSERNMLLLNDGTGHFTEKPLPSLHGDGYTSYSAVVFDIDGDGDDDIFFSSSMSGGTYGTKNEILLGDGDGTFEVLPNGLENMQGIRELLQAGATASIAADFNGDGTIDLFVYTQHTYTKNTIWMNDGTGKFEEGAELTRIGNSRHAVALDADMDGDLDIFAVYYDEVCELLINDGEGDFVPSSDFGDGTSLSSTWNRAVAADFNGDGMTDLYVGAMGYGDRNLLLLSNGDGTFTSVQEGSWYEDTVYYTGGLDYGFDIDGDGSESGAIKIFLNDGSAEFTYPTHILEQAQQNGFIDCVAGDFDGDGDLDLYVTSPEYDYNRLYLNCGTVMWGWDCGYARFQKESQRIWRSKYRIMAMLVSPILSFLTKAPE